MLTRFIMYIYIIKYIMPKLSRFSIAKDDIVDFFNSFGKITFKRSELIEILNDQRKYWRLAVRTTGTQFIEQLVQTTPMQQHVFNFPYNRYDRYSWGPSSIYNLVLSLKKDLYLTHYTALEIHNLTDQTPNSIYANFEQTAKKQTKIHLEQANINRAFSRPQRVTKTFTNYEGYTIFLLNGKYSNQLGVIDVSTEIDEKLRVTDIERTLIDITIRPNYAGGVFEVLNAYKRASGEISVNKLRARLIKLNYIYPYHQCIGFYLEKSGAYNSNQIELFRDFDFINDFYLTYNMKDKNYSKRWKLYYPKGF